ncbi:hypothetical protein FRC10_002415 [Ceratobasidium sp. 414]|nr:hypothetical protein FRC10_002415 [Ceratobasidium sp. 414]
MPRSTSTVLGLPMPNIPVDIDAPRASRTLKRPTNADASEDSSNSQNAPPRKVKKTTSSAAQEGRQTGTPLTVSTEPAEPVLVTEALKPTKAPKKKKKKNAAPAGDTDGDVAMSAPAPGVSAEPGSIVIGGSIVPPSPAKKKSRNKKTTLATALGAEVAPPANHTSPAVPVPTDVASGSALVDTMIGSKSSAAAGPGTGSGRGTGRTKTASALAQRVLEQETQKKLEKEAKAQRKKERAQKAAIIESPEDTAAFVAAADASNGVQPTKSNVEICVPEAPVTTGGLQRVQQGSVNRLITQRITQRLLSSAPPSSPASTSGSEAPGTALSSRAPSASHSYRASRTPSISLPPSRSISVAPSVRSTSVAPSARSTPAPTFSGMSRAMSSQPPTCPPSPGSPAPLTLADHLDGVDKEFAPLLPVHDPLPRPLRPPERLKPVPYKDVGRLTVAERREYIKECKFGVKDLTPDDQIMVSSVISRLEALLLTIDCFPSEADTRHLILVANAWACRKHNLGNLDVEVGGPYEDLLLGRMPQMRTGIIEYTSAKVAEVYKIQTVGLTPEVVQYNRDTMKYWTTDGNFTCPPDDFGALYERSTLEDILRHAFFQKHNSVGVIHRDLFSTIPIGAVATAAAGLEKSLMEYETGVRVKQNFSRTLHRPKWIGHVAALCTIIKSPHGGRLINHLRELGRKFLEQFPQVSDSMNTVVALKIPSIAARYGQSIAAPPPPRPPSQTSLAVQPTSSAPTPQPEQPNVAKPKLKLKPKPKPKLRLPPATILAPVPVAAPPAPMVPIKDDSDVLEPDMDAGLELDQGATADVGDPDAWAGSIQAESTPMAQYDVLNEMLGGESSDGEGDPLGPVHAAPEEASSESEDESEDESAGEGTSGAGKLAARQDSENHGSEDSGSEDSDEE